MSTAEHSPHTATTAATAPIELTITPDAVVKICEVLTQQDLGPDERNLRIRKIAADYSPDEKASMFSETARRTYRL